jgi:hypothetical protein
MLDVFLAYFSTLKTEAIHSSEMSTDFHRTTQHNIPEDKFPPSWSAHAVPSTLRHAYLGDLLPINRSVFLVAENLTTQYLSSYIRQVLSTPKTYSLSSANASLINFTRRE